MIIFSECGLFLDLFNNLRKRRRGKKEREREKERERDKEREREILVILKIIRTSF